MADISKITPPGSQTTYNLKDAAAREQAAENKNNILYAQKTGVKNIMDLSKYKELNPSLVVGDNLVFHGVTWSISNSSGLTVSGTADSSGSYPQIYSATLPIGTYYLTGGDSTIEMLTPNNQRESGQGLTIEITDSTTQPYVIRGYVPPSTAITGTHNTKPMLRQVGDSTFEPYAMSNAELTAAEKQNENNISIVDITSDVTAKSGYTVDAMSHLYRQGKHVFGTLVIKKASGNFSSASQETVATIGTYAPEYQYLGISAFTNTVWAVQNIGYVFVQNSGASSAGEIIVMDTASTNNCVKIPIDYVMA